VVVFNYNEGRREELTADVNQPNRHMSQEITMPLSTARKNDYIARLRQGLLELGTTMRLPKGKGNTAPFAMELFLSYILQSYATARYNAARKNAVKVGVLFDHEKKPLPPGTKKEIYNDTAVCISVEVRSPYAKTDIDKLSAFLIGRGVSSDDMVDAIKFASSDTKPPHIFTADLVTDV
jgi:hypothetical protein